MMTVTVVVPARPAAHDDLRLHEPDRPHDLADQILAAPGGEGGLTAFAEAEVVEGAVEQLSAVDRPGVEALPGADDPEGLAPLRPGAVLPALTAGRRPV